ncbi:MAG: beta-ketoacyl-[acyl-carrier-protein] synthase family protein, partial [Candidatus Hydrogenedentes bacterium]|nr:beta-ketoacyl-[acyl-carrier-protein] synthase family protein [Candidatus Hydrogenedentota bacterium]
MASGCSTGLDVLNWGVRQIQSDLADAAVVGATDSPMTPLMFGASCALGILSEQTDHPAG